MSHTHEQRIEDAKTLLKTEGYVVIPKERCRTLRVDRRVDAYFLQSLRGPKDVAHFQRYEDGAAANALAYELVRKAGTKTDIGYDAMTNAYLKRWEVEVILPGSK